MRTFLGFDTWEDAKTFQNFLIRAGYEKVDISKHGNLWRVYYNEK